jgi:hypothetical protein
MTAGDDQPGEDEELVGDEATSSEDTSPGEDPGTTDGARGREAIESVNDGHEDGETLSDADRGHGADGAPRPASRESPDETNDDETKDGDSDDDDGSPTLAGILGAEDVPDGDDPPRPTIEPETPDLEHVVFVVLGVVLTLLVVYQLYALF